MEGDIKELPGSICEKLSHSLCSPRTLDRSYNRVVSTGLLSGNPESKLRPPFGGHFPRWLGWGQLTGELCFWPIPELTVPKKSCLGNSP